MHLTDLYKKACSGNESDERQLFDHLKLSFKLFLQHKVRNQEDIEDIVQNALIFISGKYKEIEIETSFPAWANRVLYNKLGDYIRSKSSKKSKAQSTLENEEWHPDFEKNPMLIDQLLKCLKKIHNINPNHARIINLYYQGFTTKEICKIFEWTSNNLYVNLHRARNLLKDCLEKGGIDDE